MTSAQENAARVRQGYDFFNTGNVEGLRQLLAQDLVWHGGGRGRFAGDKRGRDATLAYFGQLGEASGGTFRAEVHDVVANEHHVVGLHVSTAQREGERLSVKVALVFHLQDGLLVEVWEHYEDSQTWDDFWS